jgi:glycosyltransferase involved in cell wall biosynthesis
MKVAVYTIALNERQFVQKWYDSAKDADYLLIADTGSSDGTKELAESLGIHVIDVSVKPWRFDDARNASLAALPSDIDYCIALDMDEELQPGWKESLEKAYESGWSRPRYNYTWSWNQDGTPGLQYGGDKIHTRKNYRWKFPVHEVLTVYGQEETQGWIDLEIHHHPDSSKPRSQYLPLLKMSVQEDPYNDRNAHYYARELYFYSMFSQAADEFRRHLALPGATWKPERAASMRYLAKCEPLNAEHWLKLAINEAPDRREAYVELATLYYKDKKWELCKQAAESAILITEKPLEYLVEGFAWGSTPYELAAYAAYNLGEFQRAYDLSEMAYKTNPNDERLKKELDAYALKLTAI